MAVAALPRSLLCKGRLPTAALHLPTCSYSAFSGRLNPNVEHLKHTDSPQWNITYNNRFSPVRAAADQWATTISSRRHASSSSNRSLPTVMDFPNIVWPSVLKTIKNWIMVNFIIQPYFDREFNMNDFVGGTKQALEVVSASMSSGDIKQLNGLVSDEAVSELETTVNQMSMAQRNEIAVIKDDIYLSFPYQVGIIFDETENELQKRWVEITMVYHVLRGLREMQDQGIVPPINIGLNPEYRDRISICNYRFIKEFTQGHESDWTINVANHFKPADDL